MTTATQRTVTAAVIKASCVGPTITCIMTTIDTSTVSTATAYGKLAGMTNVMTTRRSTVGDMERRAMMQAGVVWCRMMQTDKVMIK